MFFHVRFGFPSAPRFFSRRFFHQLIVGLIPLFGLLFTLPLYSYLLFLLMMEVERIFSADQIKIHPDLAKILREYTKAAIRANPQDLLDFSRKYFKKKLMEQEDKKIKDWEADIDDTMPDFGQEP
jgi:hypothetical protein